MSPDDERHGTVAGFVAHGRAGAPACERCLTAKRSYEKARQMYGNRKVSALGSQRRVQALRALGHSKEAICAAGGWTDQSSLDYALRATTITPATAKRVAAAYEALCMTLADGPKANRMRLLAARKGWAPPLAWNDIDDPNEKPAGWQYREQSRFTRAETMRELDHLGEGITGACRRLQVTREGLEKWAERHDMRDVYERMIAREQPRHVANQHMERTA